LDQAFLLRGVMNLVPLLLSLTVHEFAHAWSAYRLGDDTAARAGRLSLNPLVHADLVGTILLPFFGVPFGWAKPVPVDPTRFRRDLKMTTGMMITAAAGPLANVLLAVAATVLLALLARLAPQVIQGNSGLRTLLAGGLVGGRFFVGLIGLNVMLAHFNLLPIPPLDGSRIVDGLLPYRMRPAWESFARLAPFLLVGVIMFGGRLIAGPADFVLGMLQSLFHAIV
jgi:Zn-dependent protease